MTGTLVPGVAAWLLTYLVHSTLLLGGVALLTRYVVKRESLRETLWKTALVGGLITATVAVSLPRPGAFRVELAALSSPAVELAEPAAGPFLEGGRSAGPGGGLEAGLREGAAEGTSEPGGVGPGEASPALVDGPEAEPGPASGRDPEPATGSGLAGVVEGAGGLPAVAVAVWLLVALALLGKLVYRHARLRALLGYRRQVPGSAVAASVLTELRRTAGVWTPVRLTFTPAVATPLALGRVEICLPDRFLEELDPAEQRAALAHELAHLARRDPMWQVAGAVIGAVFFFQPLNQVARREIRAAAEYLADGWAVRQTGSQVELARCLASVAGWVAPSSEPALAGTVAMAEGGSPLLVRVQRLLEREPERATRPALRVAAAALVLAVAAGFGPVVASGSGGSTAPASDPAPGPEPSSEPVGGDTDTDRDTETSTDSDADTAASWDGAAASGGDQAALEVRRFDGPAIEGDGFVARLNAAGRDAAGSPYWVAYAIRGDMRGELVIDSDGWSDRDFAGAPLSDRLGVTDGLWAAVRDPLIVLVALSPEGAATRVARITVRRPELGMPLRGTVYWLGYPELEESLRWFRDMHRAVVDRRVRATAVAAMGVHPLAEAGALMREILRSGAEGEVREEAAEGLGRQPADTAVARLLFDVAMNDEDRGVRQQAAEALGRQEPGLAVELLIRLAAESRDERVQQQAAETLADIGTPAAMDALAELVVSGRSDDARREALESLARHRGGAGGELLLRMAMTDDDPDLRREAVELMADLPPDQAVALLRRVAFESGDQTAEAQASETLGDVGTAAALAVLVEIVQRNPGEEGSFQAVEAIAENFPRDQVIPILRDVVANHPSSRVRREAIDRLGDLGG